MNRTPIIIAVVIIAIIVLCCCSLFMLFWTIGSWQESQEPYSYGSRFSELPASGTQNVCLRLDDCATQDVYAGQELCVVQDACAVQPDK